MHFLTLKRKLMLFVISLSAFMLSFSGLNKILAQTVNQAEFLMSSVLTVVEKDKTFTVNLGINNSSSINITAIDSILYFNSNLFEVVSAELGGSNLKTLVPGDSNVLDLAKAVIVNSGDPAKSTLEIGLVSFDRATDVLTPGISGNFDPTVSPLVKITFKAKEVGRGQISFRFDGLGITTDSNAVILNGQNPEDILKDSPQKIDMSVIYPCVTVNIDNSNNAIDIADVQSIAGRWNLKPGDPLYDTKYDLNSDGVIDIADLQSVAGRFGETCQP